MTRLDLDHLAGTAAALVTGDRRAEALREVVRQTDPLLSAASVEQLVEGVVWRLDGLGELEPLLDDANHSEVMVNGDGRVWVERQGTLRCTDLHLSAEVTLGIIERIVAPLGLRIDRSSPLVDARLPDGSRVNAVIAPLAIDGPVLTIRRFGAIAIPLDLFATEPVVCTLTEAVTHRANILVSGGTGSGKTTLLNALGAFIPLDERVVTVEDAAELRLPGNHVVRLESRPANLDGVGATSVRDLVRNALRMRPDRIIVGEVRGGEALDMVQAMNTGHEGSMSTCHANSTTDALRRIETMILMGDVDLPLAAIREQMASSIDLVVQVARAGSGRRIITEVVDVGGRLHDGRFSPAVVWSAPLSDANFRQRWSAERRG